MARKGTLAERIIAIAIGFIAYGITYLVGYSVVGGDSLPAGLLGLVWAFSVLVGLVCSWVTALVLLKVRP
jgi:hypothetical protein